MSSRKSQWIAMLTSSRSASEWRQLRPFFRERASLVERLVRRAETVGYHLFETVSGLSEERPPFWQTWAEALATSLRMPAPRVATSVTIGRSRAEVLHAFVQFEAIRRFMKHLQRVDIARGEDIATVSLGGLEPRQAARAGVVTFTPAPGKRGTEVKIVLPGAQPTGRITRALSALVAAGPRARLRGDLRRLRQRLEAGEVPTTQGQPTGRRMG